MSFARRLRRVADRYSAKHDVTGLRDALHPPIGWQDVGRTVMRAGTVVDDERIRAAIVALGPEGAVHAAKLREGFVASLEVLDVARRTLEAGIELVDKTTEG